jgi:hypothetical protein
MPKNRLNPNPNSRATLAELQGKNILQRQMVGLRHIIRADSGAVEYLGFDVPELYRDNAPPMPNFHPGVPHVAGRVTYNKGRAQISATTGRKGYEGHFLDISKYFPVNELATALLRQPCTKDAWFDAAVPMYGDAILVTDRRAHWVLNPYRVKPTAEDLELCDQLLRSPRTLIQSPYGPGRIFFHEEPCQHDLVALKLRWY